MPKETAPAVPDEAAAVASTMAQAEVQELQRSNTVLLANQDALLEELVRLRERLDDMTATQTAATPAATKRTAEQKALQDELEAIRAEFKDYGAVETWSARVFDERKAGTDGLRLLDDPEDVDGPDDPRRRWKLRWLNLAKEGQASKYASRGWVKVLVEEVADAEHIMASLPPDAPRDRYLRRGDRGTQVLYKKPMRMYLYDRKVAEARRRGILESAGAMRDILANRTAAEVGKHGVANPDQVGSFIHGQRGFFVDVQPAAPERYSPHGD